MFSADRVSSYWPRLLLCVSSLFFVVPVSGQNAQVSGQITDESKAAIEAGSIEIVNLDTAAKLILPANKTGLYVAPSLPPGRYNVTASARGFASKQIEDVRLRVAAKVTLDFILSPGQVNQTITVNGSGEQINTTDAAVNTVIDRRFVENLPLNGRSFQSLMTVVPGVSIVPSRGSGQSGELSVNGQRTEANYFTVDGVSANTGAGFSTDGAPGAGFAGATPSQSAIGTTQSLVSVDALEEFRANTSTYSAEYGRTPGGQFQFNTRSGANEYHGTVFDYLRNDVLDARNPFDSVKQKERQNDFGGTLGGYVQIPKLYNGKDRTFFFFSYEGLRLRNPTPSQLYRVPSNTLRATAPAALQPFLASFPVSNAPDNGNGLADYYAGYSSPSAVDATSIRIDHSFSERFKVFGRYSDSPSNSAGRQPTNPAQVNGTDRHVKTLTLGATTIFSPSLTNDLRFNVTDNNYESQRYLDNFGGASPIQFGNVPGLRSSSWLTFFLFYDLYPYYLLQPQSNTQRQFNIVDSFSHSLGRHNLKYGGDFRRVRTSQILPETWEVVFYSSLNEVLTNQPTGLRVYNQGVNMNAVFANVSAFIQDEWKVNQRFNVSLGLRWDLNPAPYDAAGNTPYTVNQISDTSTLRLAPRGTALWRTTYKNFAPRIGLAYQLRQSAGYRTVLRAGGGLFYDTGTSLGAEGYYGVGYYGFKSFVNTPFPLSVDQLNTTPAPNAGTPYNAAVKAFDPNLRLPYTWQWNAAIEQALGQQQTLTMNYVGSAGHRLLTQRLYYPTNNPDFSEGLGLYLTANGADSNYHALQIRLQRALSHGFQSLFSYTWAHSIDNASSNFTIFSLKRSASDFDIRHNFQAALTYDIPGSYSNHLAAAVLRHWSVDGRVSARSALPIDVVGTRSIDASGANISARPNRVFGQPLYIDTPDAPGGRRINLAAFSAAPVGQEGNLGRNAARGFDAVQGDVTIRRDFPFTERVGLQLRAEAYNILNHPVFGSVYSSLENGAAIFGRAYNTQSSQLGGLSSIYQIGGARSIQLALKLHF